MTSQQLFGWIFITFGISIFFLPDHPKLINCLILALYCICACWWGFKGYYWDAGYWVAAFAITFVVTFGYLRRDI